MSSEVFENSRSSSDPRVLRSERAIEEALLAELREGRDLSSLTVSQIAASAGVTRKTFYARFGSLEQVASRLAGLIFRETASRIDDELLRIPLPDRSLSRLVFRAYDEHQAVLAPLVRHCPASLFLEPVAEVTAPLLDRMVEVNGAPALSGSQRDYLIAALSSVMYGVFSVWVQRGFSESPEEVALFADRLLADGLERVLLRASP